MAKNHNPGFLRIAEEARLKIKEISAEDLKQLMGSHGLFYLVDVREDHEWKEGHLPGAIHIGRGILERDIETHIPKFDAEIVLYCGGGYRSALAAASLIQMGYVKVNSLAGGFRGWTVSGYAIEKDQKK